MHQGTLIPNSAEVELMCLRQRAGAIEVELRTRRRTASCPHCGTDSARIHSRYRRKLADLPWAGVPVRIVLQTRKFFCVRAVCSQRVFTERPPGHRCSLRTQEQPLE
ncbi:MAG: transposase family protein [Janthinobacterium lividum]